MQASSVAEVVTADIAAPTLLGAEVEILSLGAKQKTPYIGCVGRIVEILPEGFYKVILDDDPIPRWRDIGIQCKLEELRILED